MKSLLIATLCLFTLSALAASHKVLTVTNDYNSEVTTITILTNEDGSAHKLKQTIVVGAKLKEENEFSFEDTRRGVVLYRDQGYDIISLKVLERFETTYGGPLHLSYLANGITGSRKFVPAEAVREGNKWMLKADGKVVTVAAVKANRVLGKVVGVDRITFK